MKTNRFSLIASGLFLGSTGDIRKFRQAMARNHLPQQIKATIGNMSPVGRCNPTTVAHPVTGEHRRSWISMATDWPKS